MNLNDFKTPEDKEQFLKKIYEYCVLVNWDSTKLEEKAKEYDVNKYLLKSWAKRYAKNYLSDNEYKQLLTNIDEINLQNQRISKYRLSVTNFILKEKINKETNMIWEDEFDKEIVLKYIYDYCEECEYDKKIVNKLSDKLKIGTTKIFELSKEYAINYLNISNEEYSEIRKEQGRKRLREFQVTRPSKTRELFEELLELEETDVNGIINAINNSGLDTKQLNLKLSDYIAVYKNSSDEVREKLEKKVKIYRDYKNDKNKRFRDKQKEELLEIEYYFATNMINAFIEDIESISIDEFCKKKDIKKSIFENYVLLLKEKNIGLYEKYVHKINNAQSQRYAILTWKIRKMVELIKNGIEEENIKRTFDIIDYCLMFNIELKRMLEIAKNILNNGDYILLVRFAKANESSLIANNRVKSMIMNENVEINCQKDKKGNPIPGTGEIFSNEKKKLIFKYLENNNIPVNGKTYTIVYRKYINGFIDLDEIKIKIK